MSSMSRHIYRSGKAHVTLGLDRTLRRLFGFVQTSKTRAPKPLTLDEIMVSLDGLSTLFHLAKRYGPVPESCREALELEVQQFIAGAESHNVVVLHRNELT